MNLTKLILRVVVGGFFVGHGLQKLTGAFGGGGLEGTEKIVESLDLHPAPLQARAVALAETLGGAAIVAGVATPYAAAALIATMTTAIRKVHLKNGPWNSNRGYEYNVVLSAALLTVAEDPGALSVDAVRGDRRHGLAGAAFALGAGIAGSLAATELGRAPGAR